MSSNLLFIAIIVANIVWDVEANAKLDFQAILDRLNKIETQNVQLLKEHAELKKENAALSNRIAQLSQHNHLRETALQPLPNRGMGPQETVAFSATMTTTQMNIGIHQNLVFDRVLLNEGSGYHPLHGLFIAPQSGIYIVSASIMTWNGRVAAAEIVKNGNVQARVYAHDSSTNNWNQGSQTIFINMTAGDELSVRSFGISNAAVYGDDYPSFSGYLLFPL